MKLPGRDSLAEKSYLRRWVLDGVVEATGDVESKDEADVGSPSRLNQANFLIWKDLLVASFLPPFFFSTRTHAILYYLIGRIVLPLNKYNLGLQ